MGEAEGGELKILFLDDSAERHATFAERSIGHDVFHAHTVEEAIAALQNHHFDMASLDHDLGGEVYAPGPSGTGQEVAAFIANMPPQQAPPVVYVHSKNDIGAAVMMRILGARGRRERHFDAHTGEEYYRVYFGDTGDTVNMDPKSISDAVAKIRRFRSR